MGIDPSLNGTGLCIIDAQGAIVAYDTLCPPSKYKAKKQHIKRLHWIRDTFRLFLEYHGPVQMAAIEGGALGRHKSRGQLYSLGEAAGNFKLECFDQGIPLTEMTPTQVKKFLTNDGRADKDTIVEMVERSSDITGLTTDEADAYCLARAARFVHLYRQAHPVVVALVRAVPYFHQTMKTLVVHQP